MKHFVDQIDLPDRPTPRVEYIWIVEVPCWYRNDDTVLSMAIARPDVRAPNFNSGLASARDRGVPIPPCIFVDLIHQSAHHTKRGSHHVETPAFLFLLLQLFVRLPSPMTMHGLNRN